MKTLQTVAQEPIETKGIHTSMTRRFLLTSQNPTFGYISQISIPIIDIRCNARFGGLLNRYGREAKSILEFEQNTQYCDCCCAACNRFG